ncbi:MAG TPA: IS3 family transposase [Gemmatimonadaceae bacterium]|nr:IS3 family transposase [Gemmatimonadaceae bacterium]
MIDRTHRLSIPRPARLLGLSRASAYYAARVAGEATLTLTRRIDELPLERPFAGSRMLRDLLNDDGVAVGREHGGSRACANAHAPARDHRHLSAAEDDAAASRAPGVPVSAAHAHGHAAASRLGRRHHVYLTYIPMARGFVYLVAVMDWASRTVLTWRVSPMLTSDFCVAALEEALDRFGTPEIFNTDQGSQFTSAQFLNVLRRREMQSSMDGRGCWRDNVVVERLWRSVKYEEVYLHAYETVSQVRAGLSRDFQFFNHRRPHAALSRRTPDSVYFTALPRLLTSTPRAVPLIPAA